MVVMAGKLDNWALKPHSMARSDKALYQTVELLSQSTDWTPAHRWGVCKCPSNNVTMALDSHWVSLQEMILEQN